MRLRLATAAFAALLFAPAAGAQTGFMPYVGYNLEYESVLVGVGARLGFSFPAAPVSVAFQPAVEVNLDSGTYIQADANAVAELSAGGSIAPYAGLGLGVLIPTEGGGDAELGLNVLGGVIFNTVGFIRPFVQGRYSTASVDAFSIHAGAVLGF